MTSIATPASHGILTRGETTTMSKYGSYWAGTGAHQAEFKQLRTELVPLTGPAATPHGELLRAVAALYHDLKRHGLSNVADHWADWHTVYAHRAELTAAVGPEGPWVFAVLDRAMTERYLSAKYGEDDAAPRKLPDDCFERLIDACVLIVGQRHGVAVAA